MILYVLRHAIAEERLPGLPDAERALTDDGREKLKQVLKRARAAGAAPALILTSPLLRAKQTAVIAEEILKCAVGSVETKALAPRASSEATWAEVLRHAEAGDILVTGHEPHLSQFIAFVLGSPQLQIEMKKAAMVRLRIDNPGATPHGTLEWMLTPRLAR